MNTQSIGIISGVLCAAGFLPYAIRTYRKEIRPQITSWLLWALIALAILLSYKSVGATDNIWPAIVGLVGPTTITVLAVWKQGEWNSLRWYEYLCIPLCILALALWWKTQADPERAQFALYLSIVADACAAVPTIIFVWTHPDGDRPFIWLLFSVGMIISMMSITVFTWSNFIYPIYMTLGSTSVAVPLVLYRIKHKVAIQEWI